MNAGKTATKQCCMILKTEVCKRTLLFYFGGGDFLSNTMDLLPFYVFEDVALIVSCGDLEGQRCMVTL